MVEALRRARRAALGRLPPGLALPGPVRGAQRAECLSCEVIKAFARTADHHVDALLAIARRIVPLEVATLTQAGLGFIEICPPGVDKATGLSVVAQSLGVDPAEVLVFGDMPNDLPIFEWAGWARVAVSNAHPTVRAAAERSPCATTTTEWRSTWTGYCPGHGRRDLG